MQQESRTIAYIRVSTDKQDAQSQRQELQKYAAAHGLHVDQWIEVEMSATKAGYARRRIDELLRVCKAGDTLLVSEISRLARSVKEVHEICAALLHRKCAAHFIKQGFELRDDLASKIYINAFGLAAEIEADLISQRTRAGLAAAKARGVKLGNPHLVRDNVVRSANADRYLLSIAPTLSALRRQGMGQQAMARALGEAGIKSPRGLTTWRVGQVQNCLRRLAKVEREGRWKVSLHRKRGPKPRASAAVAAVA